MNERLTQAQIDLYEKIRRNGGRYYCDSTTCKECGKLMDYSR